MVDLSLAPLQALLHVLNEAGVTAYKSKDVTIVLGGPVRLPSNVPAEIEHDIIRDVSDGADSLNDEPEESLHLRLHRANFAKRER